VFILLSIWF